MKRLLSIDFVPIYLSAVFLILGLFIDYPVSDPMTVDVIDVNVLYLSLAASIAMLATSGIIAYFLWNLISRTPEPYKRYITYMFFTFSFAFLSNLVGLIRIYDLLFLGTTDVLVDLLFRKIYIDPWSIAASEILIATAFFYYLLYSYHFLDKEIEGHETTFWVIFYAITFAFTIHPSNNYSQAVEETTPVKILTRVLLLIAILAPTIYMFIGIRRRLKVVTDPVTAARYKVLFAGNIFVVLVLVAYILDAFTPQPYSYFMLPGYLFNILAILFIGIAVLSPKWFEKLIKSRLAS